MSPAPAAEAPAGPDARPDFDRAMRECFERIAAADFSARLSRDAGALSEIVNKGLGEIETAIDEVLALTDLLAEGDLSTAANGNYCGNLLRLRDAFNRT
ncbi:MAG TPA: hypothetical protein VFR34_04645, partial [Paracoccaceae bacterium]|nr:hypothetical protein [Paracoccaceae bacterium]